MPRMSWTGVRAPMCVRAVSTPSPGLEPVSPAWQVAPHPWATRGARKQRAGARCALERGAVSRVGSGGRTPRSGAVEAVGAGGGVRR